jgi:hypothetical protein
MTPAQQKNLIAYLVEKKRDLKGEGRTYYALAIEDLREWLDDSVEFNSKPVVEPVTMPEAGGENGL